MLRVYREHTQEPDDRSFGSVLIPFPLSNVTCVSIVSDSSAAVIYVPENVHCSLFLHWP